MKYLLILSLAAVSLTGFLQKGTEVYTVEAKDYTVIYIPGDKDSIQGVTVGYKENGELVQNRGKLEDGKYIIKGKVSGVKSGDLVLVKKKGKGFSINFSNFILEPGVITINASTQRETYKGTPLQEEFTRFDRLARDISDKLIAKEKALKEYEKSNNTLAIENIEKEMKKLSNQRERIWEKYFESNANPLITAFMLKRYVTEEWINLDKAARYYEELPKSVKELSDIKLFGEQLKKTAVLTPGNKLPDFSLPDQSGKLISAKQYRGKYLLIDFWASWCGPCRKESPNLVALYQQYNDQGLEILNVSFDENKTAWLKAIGQDKYTWTNVVDSVGMSKSKVAELFNIKSIPKNLLIDKNGVIVARNIRGEELKDRVTKLVNAK